MKTIPYSELRDLILKSNNKQNFEFENIESEHSHEKVLCTYLLGDYTEIEYLLITQSKYMDAFFAIETRCSSTNSCREAYNCIREFFCGQKTKENIYLCDYTGRFVEFLSTETHINIDNICHYRSYVYDNKGSVQDIKLPYDVSVTNFCSKTNSINIHIDKLIEQLPTWKMHIQKCVNSLEADSDSLYIIKKNNCPVGFLSSLICDNKKYRDVALIVVSENFKNQGLGTLLSKYYISDCLNKNCIPLYTQAENLASQKVAQNSGFIYAYSTTCADISKL